VASVVLQNRSSDRVTVTAFDASGSLLEEVGTLDPDKAMTLTPPRCQIRNFKAIDARGTARWESQPILGHPSGASFNSWFG
jgi:hypothetical protein